MSADLHVVDPASRLEQLRGDEINIGALLSDSYRQAAGDETLRRLEAMRESVKLIGIDATLRLAALQSSITPSESVPFWPQAWVEINFSGGEAQIESEPYRVVAVQKEVTGESLSFEYDPTTGTLTATGSDAGYSGSAWIVEMRLENPYIGGNVAQSHGLSNEDFQPAYPPPHFSYVTEVIEQGRQQAARPTMPLRLGQALLGVPFAYRAGTIQKYTVQNGLARAHIQASDGTDTISFLPYTSSLSAEYESGDETISSSGNLPLKATGTAVERYEPLVNTEASVASPNANARQSAAPVKAVGSVPQDNQIELESGASPSISPGDVLSIRIVNQDFDRTLRAESVSLPSVTVVGEVPPIGADDWAYVVPTSEEASGADTWGLTLDTPYPMNTTPRKVRNELRRALPPDKPASIQINTSA